MLLPSNPGKTGISELLIALCITGKITCKQQQLSLLHKMVFTIVGIELEEKTMPHDIVGMLEFSYFKVIHFHRAQLAGTFLSCCGYI